METSSARPYFAIFAIVAIGVAAFILKNEFAGAAQPDKVATQTVDRMLVMKPGSPDMVPEEVPVWFKRVGYERLGFASQDEMQKTQDLMMTKGLTNVTLPYVEAIADSGLSRAIADDPALAKGVNTLAGNLTYRAVAEAHGLPYTPLEDVERAMV